MLRVRPMYRTKPGVTKRMGGAWQVKTTSRTLNVWTATRQLELILAPYRHMWSRELQISRCHSSGQLNNHLLADSVPPQNRSENSTYKRTPLRVEMSRDFSRWKRLKHCDVTEFEDSTAARVMSCDVSLSPHWEGKFQGDDWILQRHAKTKTKKGGDSVGNAQWPFSFFLGTGCIFLEEIRQASGQVSHPYTALVHPIGPTHPHVHPVAPSPQLAELHFVWSLARRAASLHRKPGTLRTSSRAELHKIQEKKTEFAQKCEIDWNCVLSPRSSSCLFIPAHRSSVGSRCKTSLIWNVERNFFQKPFCVICCISCFLTSAFLLLLSKAPCLRRTH